MADLPEVISPTVSAIWAAREAVQNRHDDHPRLSASSLGGECDRQIWRAFRWADAPEQFDGRKLSIFETGNVWEDRLVEDLRRAGMEVDAVDPTTGEQFRVVFAAGHASGRTDGKARGVPDAPKTEHLLECKSHNHKSFTELKRKGVKEAKPAHYAQMTIYLHEQGLTRALYLAVNKNDDELYAERVEYDAALAMQLVAKAERLVRTDQQPECGCPSYLLKHGYGCAARPADTFARRTCRTCLHATAEMDGDGRWSCARFRKDLTHDEQRTGCPSHLFLPSLVPGEQIDSDEAAEVVVYRLADGTEWRDGGTGHA